MSSSLFTLTALLYAGSCVVFLLLLVKDNDKLRRSGKYALGITLLVHAAFMASQYSPLDADTIRSYRHWLSVLAFGITFAFLIASIRQRVEVLGAFITPVVLMLIVASGVGESYAPISAPMGTAMLASHIGANIAGLIAFAMAFASAVAYLMVESLLRRRKVTGVFQRLPSLDALDTLSHRAAMAGFPLLSIGMVTGTVWIFRSGPEVSISLTTIFALTMWGIFAAVLILRAAVGWQGRRAAMGTIVGFLIAIGVLAGYVLRAYSGMT